MLIQHLSHLASTCNTVRQHLKEVRTAITIGKSPAGATLAPLPEHDRTQLLAALDLLAARIDELAREFIPPTQIEQGASALGATRMWVGILLRTCEELLEDLRPARMAARYGELSPLEEKALGSQITILLKAVKAALEVADKL